MDKNENFETLADNFPSNSKSQKAKSNTEKKPEERKVEKVVTGKVKAAEERLWQEDGRDFS
jgi:hypothetical protein